MYFFNTKKIKNFTLPRYMLILLFVFMTLPHSAQAIPTTSVKSTFDNPVLDINGAELQKNQAYKIHVILEHDPSWRASSWKMKIFPFDSVQFVDTTFLDEGGDFFSFKDRISSNGRVFEEQPIKMTFNGNSNMDPGFLFYKSPNWIYPNGGLYSVTNDPDGSANFYFKRTDDNDYQYNLTIDDGPVYYKDGQIATDSSPPAQIFTVQFTRK